MTELTGRRHSYPPRRTSRSLRQAKRLAALPAFAHRHAQKSLSSRGRCADNTLSKAHRKGGKRLSERRKRWISAEVDSRLIAQLEREAEARGISRSEAVRRALKSWTTEAMEEDEERITRAQANHRQLMRRLEFIVGMIREHDRRLERLAGRGAGPEPEEPEDEQEAAPLS